MSSDGQELKPARGCCGRASVLGARTGWIYISLLPPVLRAPWAPEAAGRSWNKQRALSGRTTRLRSLQGKGGRHSQPPSSHRGTARGEMSRVRPLRAPRLQADHSGQKDTHTSLAGSRGAHPAALRRPLCQWSVCSGWKAAPRLPGLTGSAVLTGTLGRRREMVWKERPAAAAKAEQPSGGGPLPSAPPGSSSLYTLKRHDHMLSAATSRPRPRRRGAGRGWPQSLGLHLPAGPSKHLAAPPTASQPGQWTLSGRF